MGKRKRPANPTVRRDNLIGKRGQRGREVTMGISGDYVWSVFADDVLKGRMRVFVHEAGTSKTMPLDTVPNYVMADILTAIATTG